MAGPAEQLITAADITADRAKRLDKANREIFDRVKALEDNEISVRDAIRTLDENASVEIRARMDYDCKISSLQREVGMLREILCAVILTAGVNAHVSVASQLPGDEREAFYQWWAEAAAVRRGKRATLKERALAKLTDEEREALGLK